MTNSEEVDRTYRDADSCLQGSKKNYDIKEYRIAVHYAQLCIEKSAKSIIAYFATPEWTHEPSRQLKYVIKINRKKIEKKLGRNMIKKLLNLAQETTDVAPWPKWSTYGRKVKGKWITPMELCTQEIAERLIEKAKRSFSTANEFIKVWSAN